MVESSGGDLFSVFNKFTSGKDMDGKTWAKLCKDCKLYDKIYTSTSADLLFSKTKGNAVRTATFEQFKTMLAEVAKKKSKTYEDIVDLVVNSSGPVLAGTKAEAVRLHDDKSSYTGVYAKGGPTNVDTGAGGKISDLSQLADRSKADVRGVKK